MTWSDEFDDVPDPSRGVGSGAPRGGRYVDDSYDVQYEDDDQYDEAYADEDQYDEAYADDGQYDEDQYDEDQYLDDQDVYEDDEIPYEELVENVLDGAATGAVGGAISGLAEPARRALPPRRFPALTGLRDWLAALINLRDRAVDFLRGHKPLVAVSGAVVLVVAAGVFVVPRFLPPPSAMAPVGPEQTVDNYFDALVAKDAQAALALVETLPADTTFLTDGVLTAMKAAHPIASVSVKLTAQTDETATVAVTYTAGGASANAEFHLRFTDRWRLTAGTDEVNLDEVVGPSSGLQLYGVDTGDKAVVTLFPGVYDLTTANPLLELTEPNLLVAGPGAPDPSDLWVVLKQEAVTAIRDAAQAKLAACTQNGVVPPAECGIAPGRPADGEIAPETITWTTLDGSSSIASINPTLQPGNRTAAAPVEIKLSMAASSTDGTLHYVAPRTIIVVQADLTDPENIQISFST